VDRSESKKIGERIVALSLFRWMPGMLDGQSGERFSGGNCANFGWPDMDDPATQGCISHLLREKSAKGDLDKWWDGPWQDAVTS